MNLNLVTIAGRLGADPVIREIAVGERVVKLATFSLASQRRKVRRGAVPGEPSQKVDQAEWHRVVAWGKQAEFCANYLKKGRLILLEGQLRVNVVPSTDSDRPSQRYVEIEANRFHFIPGVSGKRRYAEGASPTEFENEFEESTAGEKNESRGIDSSEESELLTDEEEILT